MDVHHFGYITQLISRSLRLFLSLSFLVTRISENHFRHHDDESPRIRHLNDDVVYDGDEVHGRNSAKEDETWQRRPQEETEKKQCKKYKERKGR